jgi:hypothetical protein
MQTAAQETAAAGGGGGNMIQDMPEFVLPYLIFILSHHPDYPSAEVLPPLAIAKVPREEKPSGLLHALVWQEPPACTASSASRHAGIWRSFGLHHSRDAAQMHGC